MPSTTRHSTTSSASATTRRNLADNLRNYIAGFSDNMREVIEKFDFDNTITKLDEAGLLFQVVERFKNVDLHPDRGRQCHHGHHLRRADPQVQ